MMDCLDTCWLTADAAQADQWAGDAAPSLPSLYEWEDVPTGGSICRLRRGVMEADAWSAGGKSVLHLRADADPCAVLPWLSRLRLQYLAVDRCLVTERFTTECERRGIQWVTRGEDEAVALAKLSALGVPLPATMEEMRQSTPGEDWIWKPILARGVKTLLTAEVRAGKTTLMSHFLRAVSSSGELFGEPIRCRRRVLYISEESPTIWTQRFPDVDLRGTVMFLTMPFLSKPDPKKWEAFTEAIAELVQCHPDTMS